MDMKNAKNVDFWQIDNQIKKISQKKGILVLPIKTAYKKFDFLKKHFKKEPKEGYFIWVKRDVDFPLLACITIASPRVSQELKNILIIEKNVKVKMKAICNTLKNNLCGSHQTIGKVFIKKNASLEYQHFHHWGKNDFVLPQYEFFLKEKAKLNYIFKNFSPPKEMKIKTQIFAQKEANLNLNFIIEGKNTKIDLKDIVFLEGKNSKATVRLKLVARKKSQIFAFSQIIAKNLAKGHLECQGLLVDDNSKISLLPALVVEKKNAQLTHEASIGKICEEKLIYLRQRGFSEKEAIDLIVKGFLEK